MIDSHAHISGPELYSDAEEVIARAQQAQVEKIVNICTDFASLENGIKLRQKFPQVIHNAAAIHPHDASHEQGVYQKKIESLAEQRELVAIGETGLDYFYTHASKEMQQKMLIKHLELALSHKLPVIFHCREAFADLFAVTAPFSIGAVLHCFTGTMEEARGVLDRGWYLSISGIVTYKKSEILREVAQYVPLDRLLIETDAPFLAPQSMRGKRNEPAFMIETAQMVANLKGLKLEEIAQATTQNAIQFFALNG